MEEILKQLLEGQQKLFEGQKQISNRLENVETQVTKMDQRLENVEGQLQETNVVKAVRHNVEILSAEVSGMKLTTASNTIVENINAKLDQVLSTQIIQGESINILALRQLHSESEIELLKKVK